MNNKGADQTEQMRRLVKFSDLLPTQDTVLSAPALAYVYIKKLISLVMIYIFVLHSSPFSSN